MNPQGTSELPEALTNPVAFTKYLGTRTEEREEKKKRKKRKKKRDLPLDKDIEINIKISQLFGLDLDAGLANRVMCRA